MTFTIAIDGYAASGKGTISKGVAEHFGFSYLDTGLIYRAVAKLASIEVGALHSRSRLIEISRNFKSDYLKLDGLRADEIGIPWAITVDHQTMEDETVTVRSRDDQRQIRITIDNLLEQLRFRTLADHFN